MRFLVNILCEGQTEDFNFRKWSQLSGIKDDWYYRRGLMPRGFLLVEKQTKRVYEALQTTKFPMPHTKVCEALKTIMFFLHRSEVYEALKATKFFVPHTYSEITKIRSWAFCSNFLMEIM